MRSGCEHVDKCVCVLARDGGGQRVLMEKRVQDLAGWLSVLPASLRALYVWLATW